MQTIERQLLGVNEKLAPTKGKNIRKVPCNSELIKELTAHINVNELAQDTLYFKVVHKHQFSITILDKGISWPI
jgi:hypothetical protein